MAHVLFEFAKLDHERPGDGSWLCVHQHLRNMLVLGISSKQPSCQACGVAAGGCMCRTVLILQCPVLTILTLGCFVYMDLAGLSAQNLA